MFNVFGFIAFSHMVMLTWIVLRNDGSSVPADPAAALSYVFCFGLVVASFVLNLCLAAGDARLRSR